MECDRRFGTLLLAAVVGVLAALLKLVVNPWDGLRMTVSCAHKHSTPSDAFLARDVLPSNVKPLHYDLTIIPDMSNFVFDGHATIKYPWAVAAGNQSRIHFNDDSASIQLNAKELAIKSVTLTYNGEYDARTPRQQARLLPV